MPRASVTFKYATDEYLTCEVECDSGHPDALDMLTTRAARLYAQVMADQAGVDARDIEETP